MRALRVVALVVFMLSAFPTPAAAADIRQGDSVVVPITETVNDDLYAFANNVTINGTVNGDVIATAQNVSVDGTVNGDLIAAGNNISIRGRVTGSVRVAGNTIFLDGQVNNDLFAAGNDVTVSGNGRVGRDLFAATNAVNVGGQVGRQLQAGARTVTIDGRVGGNVRAQVETLRIGERAAVDGSITYTSANEAQIAGGATVQGTVTQSRPERGPEPLVTGPGALAIDWLRGLVGLLILGLFLVLFFPGFSRRAGETLVRSPLVTLGVGAGALIVLPIVAVLLFIVGALIGGWWLGLVVLAFYFAALAVSIPIAAVGLGASLLRVTRRPAHLVIALVVGLIVLLVVAIVPVLGGIVLFVALLFGLGATAIAVVSGRGAETAAA